MADIPLRDDTNARDTDRLEAFSDGVIAIAITLLIIEVHVPDHANVHSAGDLLDELLGLWPSYIGYFVSFLTIGIMWINHHNIFRFIARTDQKLIVFILLCVAFIPFSTGVMAEDFGERRFRVGWPIYLAGALVALVVPLVGMFDFLALALFYLLPSASAGDGD